MLLWILLIILLILLVYTRTGGKKEAIAYDLLNNFFFSTLTDWTHPGFGVFATYKLDGRVIACMGNWQDNWRTIDFETAAHITKISYETDSRNTLANSFDENTLANKFTISFFNITPRTNKLGVIYTSAAGRATYLPGVFPNPQSREVHDMLRAKAGVSVPQSDETFTYYSTTKYSLYFRDFKRIWGARKIASIPPVWVADNDVHRAANLWCLYKWGRIQRPTFTSSDPQALAFVYKYNPDLHIRCILEERLSAAHDAFEYSEICWALGILPDMNRYEPTPFIWSWYTKCGHNLPRPDWPLKHYNERAVVFEVSGDFNLFIALARAGDNVRTDLLYHFLSGFDEKK